MPNKLFFGVQVAINEAAKDGLRAELHNRMTVNKSEVTPEEKKAYYRNISSVILENMFAAEYGFWDYYENDDAIDEFDSWQNDLESGTALENSELGDENDAELRADSSKDYIVVTIAVLADESSRNQAFYDQIASIKEDEYFDRASFVKIIDALRLLDFNRVERDMVFLIPGNDQDGLSWFDIHSEGWNYLKPIL
jgi:hypothetical protein